MNSEQTRHVARPGIPDNGPINRISNSAEAATDLFRTTIYILFGVLTGGLNRRLLAQ